MAASNITRHALHGTFPALRVQALEPSTLIALQLLAPGGRLVLVGDPQQLPATVVSRAAAAAALAQSLFERLQQAGYPLCLLRQQYRMHPAISAWPSAFFYSGQLQDAAALVVPPSGSNGSGGRSAPWHDRPCFPPLAFWDCREASAGAGRLRGRMHEGLVSRRWAGCCWPAVDRLHAPWCCRGGSAGAAAAARSAMPRRLRLHMPSMQVRRSAGHCRLPACPPA
jgi:hypothetical protein